ncbi:putative reverse transcriptase domain-containing protein [Tanacetum coccineum]|uniref:Reverse transcriptase domain-containing protein n=1 Tax=Tanacetum coccineum TaxID=301880 RepID=A0ABQ5CWK2_9ASTR
MSSETKLTKDEDDESVDNTKHPGIIGSLLYLTTSRSNIMFSVCLCARFQEDPKSSHLEAIKRIFRYIKGTTQLGLWYPKGTGVENIVYADSEHARDYIDHKSTSGVCTFMGCYLTSWFSKKQTALAISTIESEYVTKGDGNNGVEVLRRNRREEEFEEEEPQEEEEDMEVEIEEEENELELTFPYEEADNLPPPASDSESEDVVEVEDTIEPEDETVPASVYEVGESSTATFLQEDSDSLLPGFMRRDINSLFGQIASLSRVVCGRETAHALVEKKGKAKDKYYGKLILDLGNEVRSSVEEGAATMENLKELFEIDLYWTRVQAHEFYRKMIRRGVVFEERPNEAIDVPVEDEESSSSELRGSPPRRENVGNNAGRAGGSGQGGTPATRECTFTGFMRCNLTVFHGIEGAVELQRWFEKTESVFGIKFCPAEEVQRMEHELWNLKVKEYNIVAYTQRFNKLALMCPRMVEPENVKIEAYIIGLFENIKGEVTSSRPANLSKAVRMAHKLME